MRNNLISMLREQSNLYLPVILSVAKRSRNR